MIKVYTKIYVTGRDYLYLKVIILLHSLRLRKARLKKKKKRKPDLISKTRVSKLQPGGQIQTSACCK